MSDLIDREQAKDAIDKYLVGRNLVTDGTMMARLINEIVIDRLPSAQPTFDARDTQYNLPIGTDLISRQQAIKAFNTDVDMLIVGGEENAKAVEHYLNGVIEKIKQLPSALGTNLAEVGTDCISRQQAIDALTEYRNGRAVFISVGEAVIRIEQLPPIQPKLLQPWEVLAAQAVLSHPKRGKWIRDGHHIRCDQCGMYMCDTDREGDRIPKEFCPSCGAKMEVTT